ncbi:MAG TPA: PaaI family thioesterase [Nitrospirae bacterium]|nr:PaaI family thioesterase [Nitrospirota bacterium]HDL21115.1 PaaI family thioesterase [Nitrospirota bacterium]HDZ01551.1 PaaI family thioesterase [Nitrospirota bacterium]
MKMINLTDDGYCFVCGPKNPIGLKLKFSFDGKTIKTEFIPRREHQGYMNIVHGGIIATLLDEAMVKLAIEMGIPAVTAQMDIRLKKALRVGEKIIVTAEILKNTKKILAAYAKAVTDDNLVIADARGKLIKVFRQAAPPAC